MYFYNHFALSKTSLVSLIIINVLITIISAIITLPRPENMPLITTISSELLLLIILVQLFSNPQHTHAPKTNNEPLLKVNAPLPSKLSIILAIVTNTIANHNFLDITSLKIINAISDVATISKLFNNETFAELVPSYDLYPIF